MCPQQIINHPIYFNILFRKYVNSSFWLCHQSSAPVSQRALVRIPIISAKADFSRNRAPLCGDRGWLLIGTVIKAKIFSWGTLPVWSRESDKCTYRTRNATCKWYTSMCVFRADGNVMTWEALDLMISEWCSIRSHGRRCVWLYSDTTLHLKASFSNPISLPFNFFLSPAPSPNYPRLAFILCTGPLHLRGALGWQLLLKPLMFLRFSTLMGTTWLPSQHFTRDPSYHLHHLNPCSVCTCVWTSD